MRNAQYGSIKRMENPYAELNIDRNDTQSPHSASSMSSNNQVYSNHAVCRDLNPSVKVESEPVLNDSSVSSANRSPSFLKPALNTGVFPKPYNWPVELPHDGLTLAFLRSVRFRQFLLVIIWMVLATLQILIVLRSTTYYYYFAWGPSVYNRLYLATLLAHYAATSLAAIGYGILARSGVSIRLLIIVSAVIMVLGNAMHFIGYMPGIMMSSHLGTGIGLGVFGLLTADFNYLYSDKRRAPCLALFFLAQQLTFSIATVYSIAISMNAYTIYSTTMTTTATTKSATTDLGTNSGNVTNAMKTTTTVLSLSVTEMIPFFNEFSVTGLALALSWLAYLIIVAILYPNLPFVTDASSTCTTDGLRLKRWLLRKTMTSAQAEQAYITAGERVSVPAPKSQNVLAFLIDLVHYKFLTLVLIVSVAGYCEFSLYVVLQQTLTNLGFWQPYYVEYVFTVTSLAQTFMCVVAFRFGTLEYSERKILITGLVFIICGAIWLTALFSIPFAQLGQEIFVSLAVCPVLFYTVGYPLIVINAMSLLPKLANPQELYFRLSLVYMCRSLGQLLGVGVANGLQKWPSYALLLHLPLLLIALIMLSARFKLFKTPFRPNSETNPWMGAELNHKVANNKDTIKEGLGERIQTAMTNLSLTTLTEQPDEDV